MTPANEPADPSGSPIVAADLAEVAAFQLAFAIGCLTAGPAVVAALQPPGFGWHPLRDAGEARPVIGRAAFEGWAGRLLTARSGMHV